MSAFIALLGKQDETYGVLRSYPQDYPIAIPRELDHRMVCSECVGMRLEILSSYEQYESAR